MINPLIYWGAMLGAIVIGIAVFIVFYFYYKFTMSRFRLIEKNVIDFMEATSIKSKKEFDFKMEEEVDE